jgi:NodT family efflux transporter outer membrane factor (OMF) lipoprotein
MTDAHPIRPGRLGWRPAVIAAAATLAGCAVGPNFQPPDPPKVTDEAHPYTQAPLPAQTASAPGPGGKVQRFALGEDIPAQWWQLFRSEPLDRLVRLSLVRSPSLASAQAALRQAQENYNADAGSRLLPSLSGQLGATRQETPAPQRGAPGGTLYSIYNASVNVAYTVDAFGGIRRELESFGAVVDYQRYQVEASYLTLTTNVVTSAIQEASLRAQLQATHEVIDAEQKSLTLVRKQADLGAIPRSTVLSQQALLSQALATVPPLEKALSQTRQQLAVYTGALPDDPTLPTFMLETLALPGELPVSLPSSLVRRRPDIQAAEALLHQASAQVGIATANLYPQITLSASAGAQALSPDKLFSSGSFAWSLGAGLVQPLFNGGSLQARKRAAIAVYDQSEAQYRQTVLNAFLNVANTLSALQRDAEAVLAQADAESYARQSLDLVNRQYRLGAVSYLSLLDSQRTYLQTRITLAQAQATRYADTAALFQAMGGGWWNRAELVDISHPAANAGDAAAADAQGSQNTQKTQEEATR